MGVLDGEVAGGAVDQGQGQQQGREQVQAAAHVIDFIDFGERGHGFDRQPGGGDLQAFEQGDVVVGEPGNLLDIQMQRRNGRHDFPVHVVGVGQKGLVSFLLESVGGELGFHDRGGFCRKTTPESMREVQSYLVDGQ